MQRKRTQPQLLSGNDPSCSKGPMFCLETAIKAFFWSTLLYDYTEANDHKFTTIPTQVRLLACVSRFHHLPG